MARKSQPDRMLPDVQRWTVLVLAVAVPVVFLPNALSPFSTAKTSLIFAAAALLLALQIGRVVALGRLNVPTGAIVWAAAALAVALAIAATSGDVTGMALFGAYKRHGGLLDYWSYLVVLAVVLRRFDATSVQRIVLALLVAAGIVAVFALLQAVGVGETLFSRAEGAEGVPATLGNTNFVSGFLALALPLAAWAAFAVRTPAGRAGIGLLALVLVGGIVVAASAQGPLAAAAGMSLAAVAWARTRSGAVRRWAAPAWGTAAVIGTVLVGLGLAGHGPLSALGAQRSFELRRWYWDAAVAMGADRPLFGVGLDQYGVHYLANRPVASVLSLDLAQTNDAAHSVPLHFFAGGGAVLLAAYVAFVAVVAYFVVDGYRRSEGRDLLLVGGLAGAWLAYQVQSAVSIDVPPLALTHFLLAGGLAVVTKRTGSREVTLPWAPPAAKRRTRERMGWVVAGVLGLLGLYGALVPLRADLAAGRAVRQAQAGQAQAALVSIEKAVDLAPWESAYHFERGAILANAGQPDAALLAFDASAKRNPGTLAPLISGARVAVQLGDIERARALYARALEVEPQHPELKVEIAKFEQSQGNDDEALRLVAEALAVDPDNEQATELQSGLQSGPG